MLILRCWSEDDWFNLVWFFIRWEIERKIKNNIDSLSKGLSDVKKKKSFEELFNVILFTIFELLEK